MDRRSPSAQWPLLMTVLTSAWKLPTSQAVCWATGKQHTAYFQKANWKPGMMAQCFLQSQQEGGRTTVMNSRPPWARVIPLVMSLSLSSPGNGSLACVKMKTGCALLDHHSHGMFIAENTEFHSLLFAGE